MRRLRGLLVDNEPGNNQVIEESLDLAFGLFGWNVDWVQRTSAAQACRCVRDSEPFDFAIIDLYLASDEPNGLSIVPDIRDRQGDTYVLVVTSYPELDHNFRERAGSAGAAAVVVRNDMLAESSDWSFPALAGRIRAHLVSRGLISLGTFNYDEDDSLIMSVLETVGGHEDSEEQTIKTGHRVLHNLAMQCLDRPRIDEANFHLRYLAPGRSGAHVCRVDVGMPGEPTESFVLKFGLDKEALESEFRKSAEAARILSPQALIAPAGRVCTDVSGYSAFVAKVAEDTQTLAEWLKSAEAAAAQDVADIVFNEHLRGLFRPELRASWPLRRWVRPSALESARMRLTLQRYGEALAHPLAGDMQFTDGRLDDLARYYDQRALPLRHPERLDGDATFIRAFGDLHSFNILVRSGVHARPILVDASLYGSAHWATDAARLLVDLSLRVRESGVPSMLWNSVKPGLGAATSLCPCFPGSYRPRGTAVDALILRVIDNLPEFLHFEDLRLVQDEWHWQWHIALGREFARQASARDLTAPRAVMALASAAKHVRFGLRLLDGLKYSYLRPDD